jgi:hypothetical protein
MRTVYKYGIPTAPQFFELALPEDHSFLYVDMKDGQPWAWLLVDTKSPERKYKFKIVGTGHPIETSAWYCGTWQDGPYVWHLFSYGPVT